MEGSQGVDTLKGHRRYSAYQMFNCELFLKGNLGIKVNTNWNVCENAQLPRASGGDHPGLRVANLAFFFAAELEGLNGPLPGGTLDGKVGDDRA